jgi:ectoine hydroxylase-related dioxygenase (phytanoyl-CoA dioxygenase family)
MTEAMTGGEPLAGVVMQSILDRGFAEPFRMRSEAACADIIADANATTHRVSWYKALHEFDSACTRAATDSAVVDRITPILGSDVLLWSTQMMRKRPGESHRWHADIEAYEWSTVNGWMGLQNTNEDACLLVIPGSHRYGQMPQDHLSEGVDLNDADSVLAAARQHDPTATVVPLVAKPGEMVLFDGRMWHGSVNRTSGNRYALLTQYSACSANVRIPASYERPARWREQLPPCLLVAGTGAETANQLISTRRAVGPRWVHRLHPRALHGR